MIEPAPAGLPVWIDQFSVPSGFVVTKVRGRTSISANPAEFTVRTHIGHGNGVAGRGRVTVLAGQFQGVDRAAQLIGEGGLPRP